MTHPHAIAAVVAATLAVSGSALALSGGPLLPEPTPRGPSVQCDIELVSTPQGARLLPRAQSGTDLSGSYRLSVETLGSGGRSTVSQGGDFSIGPSRSQTLGSVSLGQASGARVDARLDLTWSGGQTHCIRRVRL